VSITLEEFQQRLEAAGDRGALRLLIRQTLQDSAKYAERQAKLKVSVPSPTWLARAKPQRAAAALAASPVLHVRTGRLRASIRSGVRGGQKGKGQGAIEGYVRAGGAGKKGMVKYAAVHELGLTIQNPWGGQTKMPKRPFLKPARDEAAARLPDALRPLLARSLSAVI
jgi:hypothetical protein